MPDIRILVLDRGFVLIAEVEKHPERAFWLRCTTRTIRVWGTTNGLGELVSGPTRQTVLDPIVIEDIPLRAILREIHAEEAGWSRHLSEASSKTSSATSSTRTGSKNKAGV